MISPRDLLSVLWFIGTPSIEYSLYSHLRTVVSASSCFGDIETSLISFEPVINIFQVTIDLGLKIKYSSCRKGNTSVVGMHSRGAHIQTIW